MNKKGYKEFSVWISKLFNGTLLEKKDENGKLIETVKFDLRTEIGITHEIERQTVPIVVNECIVRGFYFARKLFTEIKHNNVKNLLNLKNINWKNTLPFKNRTVVRMFTISTSTFMAFDIANAAIRSGGFNTSCILRINFVGIGRFAVAVGTDIGMGIKKNKKEKELSEALSEYIKLTNIKIYYRKADYLCAKAELGKKEAKMYEAEKEIWQELIYNHDMIKQFSIAIRKTCQFYVQSIQKMNEDAIIMTEFTTNFDKEYPGLREKMLKELEGK